MKIYYSEILKKQPIFNIGVIGHVAHGKSTLVRSITGTKTQKHSSEKVRNITINIGYANSKIYIDKLGIYVTCPTNMDFDDDESLKLVAHISFVDVPGHEAYMSNMVSGSAVMNSTILVVASNENIPQPQTYEHFEAIKNINVEEFIILQNKCDLIEYEKNEEVLEKIKSFVRNSIAENSTIIPSSIQNDVNRQEILKNLVRSSSLNNFNNLSNKLNKNLRMTIIRSFDVNKQNSFYTDLKGGVVGGSLLSGILKVNDYVEIRPGFISNGKYRPIYCKVLSLKSDTRELDFAVPGGLIGVGLDIDPSLSKNNGMLGQTLGEIGKLPDVCKELAIEYTLINRIDNYDGKFKNDEKIMVNINSMNITGKLVKVSKKKKYFIVNLEKPVCIDAEQNVAIFKMISGKWILYANGIFKEGIPIEKDDSELEIANEYTFEKEHIELVNDIEVNTQDLDSYENLLKNVEFKRSTSKRTYIPPPVMRKVNKDSVFTNYREMVDFLNKDSKEIKYDNLFLDFIKQETSTTCDLNKEGLAIRGVFRVSNLQNIMINFLNKYKKCNTCSSFNSYLKKSDRLLIKSCLDCKSEFSIN